MAEPHLLGDPPPLLSRDRMVACWITASVVSWLGSSAWGVALAWQAVQTMSPRAAGLVLAAATLPQALASLLGGVIADRLETRRVLLCSQLAHILLLLLGVVLWGRVPSFWLLLALGAGFGIVTGLTAPAGATLGRQLVRVADVATVAGWSQIGSRLARMAGAPVGAALVASWGLPAVMLLDAASFALVALVLLGVVRPRYRLHGEVGGSWTGDVRDGLAHLAGDRRTLVFVLGLCGLNILSTPLTGLGVPLRVTASGWPATTLGLVEAVFSAAAVAGSVLSLRWRPAHSAQAAFVLLVGQGIAYAGVAVDDRRILLAVMTIVGFTAGCASVWLSALFVQVVDPAHLGRVASISAMGDLLLVPLAVPVFGHLTQVLGIGTSPIVLAVLMVLMCLSILARTDIRQLVAAR